MKNVLIYFTSMFLLTLHASDMLGEVEKIDFEEEIFPILQKNCIKCHGPDTNKNGKVKKASGGLRLDSLIGIMRGGEGGTVLKKGDPLKSKLYNLVVLNPNDSDIMPSKGKPLTKVQTELIKNWIIQGADFGSWVGVKLQKEKLWKPISESAFNKRIDVIEKTAPPLNKEKIANLIKKGYVVNLMSKESKLLFVDLRFSKIKGGKIDFNEFNELYQNIHTLDFSKTKVDDSIFTEISKCKNLVKLNLSSTHITGKGVEVLKECHYLESLNISNTKFSPEHKSSLEKLKSLKRLYSWNTKI